MSLPRMCSLPSSSGSTSRSTGDMDKEKQRFAATAATMAFPGLPFMAAAAAFPAVSSTTTGGSSVFPNQMAAQLSLFNPHLQQYYANFLHQQQLLQSLQNHSPQSRTGPFFFFISFQSNFSFVEIFKTINKMDKKLS
ncbi:unnamed protein product [Cercopithifilaria johnstoni]|uniref:Uncharacterized protein n=1 Tax=Cercopithifilaria johnstoni TaxID=2874296 RepID=A0A8J2LTR0_9BILA|nr:unnamed protein product [Cercopithifilaria johnstoni]